MTESQEGRVDTHFAAINWGTWTPEERATLVFVVRDGHVLLIHKKRGLGAGKINGPGGRIAPGEEPRHGAIREAQEELDVTPTGVVRCGELSFQFTDGFSLLVHVFKATDYEGEPRETEEAIPLWTPLDQIPYDRMWADDRIWMPLMLAGRTFQGRFLFDGDTMLDHEVIISPVDGGSAGGL